MAESRKVTAQEGQEMADQFSMKFFEASAKDSTNVEAAFSEISTEILSKIDQ